MTILFVTHDNDVIMTSFEVQTFSQLLQIKINQLYFPSTNLIYLTDFLKRKVLNFKSGIIQDQKSSKITLIFFRMFRHVFNDRSLYIFLAEYNIPNIYSKGEWS